MTTVRSTSITLDNVAKSFGSVEVIPGISVRMAAGDFTVVLGPSGCGKSTILNMLAGLEEVSSGRILFGDREVHNVAAKDRGCAMVFQNYALYPHMNVADNIGYSLKLARVPKAERINRIREVARIANLEQFLNRRPSQLSGGQRQRVAIARAIVREPGVLLFDEPLSNLDAQLRHDMRVELTLLHRRIGATSVFVTHDQIEAMTLADVILIINNGRVEQFASPDRVYHHPQTTFVARFIGSPPMNILTGRGDGGILRLIGGVGIAELGHRGNVLVGIRPERILLAGSGLNGQVRYREDLGSHSILQVELENGEKIWVSVQHGSEYGGEGEVKLQFPEDDIHLFDPETKKRLES